MMKPKDRFYYELERLVHNFYEETGLEVKRIVVDWGKNAKSQYRPVINLVNYL